MDYVYQYPATNPVYTEKLLAALPAQSSAQCLWLQFTFHRRETHSMLWMNSTGLLHPLKNVHPDRLFVSGAFNEADLVQQVLL